MKSNMLGKKTFELQHKIRNELGAEEITTEREHALKQVLRQARRLTELPKEMISNKNLYENRLLRLMASDTEDDVMQKAIQDYYSLRLRGCLLNAEFSSAVSGTENGHMFLKALHEQVLIELNLNTDFRISDMAYDTMEDRVANTERQYDLSSPYNL